MSSAAPLTAQTYSQESVVVPLSQPTTAPDIDLMVTEEVIVGDITVEEVSEEVKTTSMSGRQQKKSKILVTLSDDLSYTLTIESDTMSAVMDSISADELMKSEWNSWQRFISNPNQFFVYIFDNDFKEYVRYRTDIPIRHLTKLKIKNKFYVNQTGLKRCYQQLVSSQSAVIDDVFDTEPTDALIGDQNNNNSSDQSSLSTPTITTTLQKINDNAINTDIISHNALKTSQYHHNYHMSSPSAPVSQLNSSSSPTEAVPPTNAESDSSKTNRSQNSSQSSKLTKAAKKLFTTESNDRTKSNSSETDSLNGDLLADAPTGPTFDWSQEQTIAFLKFCKPFSKELAPKKNVLEVKPSVWEELAKELNSKDFGYSFDALMCRNHFSRLRLTYTNVLCYPGLRDERSWPNIFIELMKEIIGEKPEEMQSKVKTRAQTQYKSNIGRPGLVKAIKNSNQNKAGPKPSGDVMKNSANQEVSELYVALLNLVKKYMKYFETETKNHIWDRIETEMNGAGYNWNAKALRGLFYRLRYTYMNIMRNVGDVEIASASWPYFKYFHGLDLKAFPCRKTFDLKGKKGFKIKGVNLKAQPLRQHLRRAKRAPGRPKKRNTTLKKSEEKKSERNHMYEYSDGQTSGSDVEAVENKRKKTESV